MLIAPPGNPAIVPVDLANLAAYAAALALTENWEHWVRDCGVGDGKGFTRIVTDDVAAVIAILQSWAVGVVEMGCAP